MALLVEACVSHNFEVSEKSVAHRYFAWWCSIQQRARGASGVSGESIVSLLGLAAAPRSDISLRPASVTFEPYRNPTSDQHLQGLDVILMNEMRVNR